MNRIARRLMIRGIVQGVGFRNTLEHRARKTGVCGWVRNRSDGSVEAVICGTEEQVQTVIDWARHGPPLARVEAIEIQAIDEPTPFERFSRLPTL